MAARARRSKPCRVFCLPARRSIADSGFPLPRRDGHPPHAHPGGLALRRPRREARRHTPAHDHRPHAAPRRRPPRGPAAPPQGARLRAHRQVRPRGLVQRRAVAHPHPGLLPPRPLPLPRAPRVRLAALCPRAPAALRHLPRRRPPELLPLARGQLRPRHAAGGGGVVAVRAVAGRAPDAAPRHRKQHGREPERADGELDAAGVEEEAQVAEDRVRRLLQQVPLLHRRPVPPLCLDAAHLRHLARALPPDPLGPLRLPHHRLAWGGLRPRHRLARLRRRRSDHPHRAHLRRRVQEEGRGLEQVRQRDAGEQLPPHTVVAELGDQRDRVPPHPPFEHPRSLLPPRRVPLFRRRAVRRRPADHRARVPGVVRVERVGRGEQAVRGRGGPLVGRAGAGKRKTGHRSDRRGGGGIIHVLRWVRG